MRTRLTPAQINAYSRDGFVVIDGFLSPREVLQLGAELDRCLREIGAARVVGNPGLSETAGYRDDVVVQRVNLWKVSETIRRYSLAPAMGRMLCSLAGIDGLRILHDQTFFKPPWADPTAFHIDLPNWPFDAMEAIQIWIALDDTTVRNGCLYYLPGSHRMTGCEQTARIRGRMRDLFEMYPELQDTEPKAVEIAAGGAVVHNGLTAHAAGPNMSPRWRRAMTCQYMPDGATFNGKPGILTPEQLARLRVGDLLDDDEHYPVVWRRPRSSRARLSR